VVATLGARKGKRWVVGFALETDDHRLRALAKLEQKCCDLMITNSPSAINSPDNEVEVLTPAGEVIVTLSGPKEKVAEGILEIIEKRLIQPQNG
jgi:phosphopantothenoylcysteine decarboxylase/phosphopantothenate--cysteine ligase